MVVNFKKDKLRYSLHLRQSELLFNQLATEDQDYHLLGVERNSLVLVPVGFPRVMK